MTRTPYDLAAKALFEEALGPCGRVVAERQVWGEPQAVDLFFERAPDAVALPGLLGGIAEHACLVEVFHQAPRVDVVHDAVCKQLVLHRERRARAAGAGGALITPLWIIAGGWPEGVVDAFDLRCRDAWPAGVYETAPGHGWYLVVTSELPRTCETLLVRLLGAGETLRLALVDLRALPLDSWERRVSVPAVDVLRWSGRDKSDPLEEAIAMAALVTYEELLDRGRAEGRAQGLAPLVRLFERKLGRQLSDIERTQLVARLESLGPDRLGDVALDLDPAALGAWLADPEAR